MILDATFLYRPSRPFGVIAALLLVTAAGLMVMPTIYYAQHGSLLSWMIYRFVVSQLLGTASLLLFSASYVTSKVVHLTLGTHPPWQVELAQRVLTNRTLLAPPDGDVPGGRAVGSA